VRKIAFGDKKTNNPRKTGVIGDLLLYQTCKLYLSNHHTSDINLECPPKVVPVEKLVYYFFTNFSTGTTFGGHSTTIFLFNLSVFLR